MNKEKFITERTRIISEMLDNPNEYGIYPTTKCFNDLDELFDKISDETLQLIIKRQEELIKLLDTEPDDYNREIDGKESKLREEIRDLEIQYYRKYEPYLYNYKTGNDLSPVEVEKAGWHIPTKIDMEYIKNSLDQRLNTDEDIERNKITEEFVKIRDSDLNHQFDYRDRDYFQMGYNLGIKSHKGSPTAYEWHNLETGHCYVDYIPHIGQDEKDGYTKFPLYKIL